MKLFLDSSDLDQIKDVLSKEIVQGITINPSNKESKANYQLHIKEIVDLCRSYKDGIPLNIRVFAREPESILSQAIDVSREFTYDKLSLQIPIGFEALHPISTLSKTGIHVNSIYCFTAAQMQCAALCGSKYISLCYDKVADDEGKPEEILFYAKSFVYNNQLECQVIADNVKTSEDMELAWKSGADIVTVNYDVLKQAIDHDKTTEMVATFLNDFQEWMT